VYLNFYWKLFDPPAT